MREKLLMDLGWKFHKGDIPNNPIGGHHAVYSACKSENGLGAASQGYYDVDWATVQLPHDYVILEEYSEKEEGNHGYLPRKNAWYRRTFKLEEIEKDKQVKILFDGVGTECTVWINGHLVAKNYSGYTSFEVDLTDVANYGDKLNTVAVYVDNTNFEGWWYEGSGIYRHVWLVKTEKVSVDLWGTWINPEKISENTWKVPIETVIRNDSLESKVVKLESQIFSPSGEKISGITSKIEVFEKDKNTCKQVVEVEKPELWCIEQPNLYKLKTLIYSKDGLCDEYETSFGFRYFRFSPNSGFYLNGKSVKIKGTSNHQDHGGLGVALPDRIQEFRVKRLKEMGCNGYRCAHNMPTVELLDECDKQGMLVMDENRWFQTSKEILNQLECMVKRDRNHPSIIMWSIGNEEPLQTTEEGKRIAETMRGFVRRYDKTRPITLAINAGIFEGASLEAVDIIGRNYKHEFYDDIHKMYPNKPIVAPEGVASVNTRGVYFEPEDKKYATAYDEKHAEFGDSIRNAWRQVDIRPFMSGLFIWSGIEYRGEATWPRLFSNCGALDNCCFKKDSFYLLKAMWKEEPTLHIMPHWNLKGHEGEEIDLRIYTNADSVELFLNGISLGEKAIDKYEQGQWLVKYEAGQLKAIAKKDGKYFAEKIIETVGEPVGIILMLEEENVRADNEDVAIITAYAVDKNGEMVPDADEMLDFSVNIAGKIIATGNGNPCDHSLNSLPRRRMFNGLCQIIVKCYDKGENLIVTAKGENLGECTLEVKLDKVNLRPYVEVVENKLTIKGWRVFPIKYEEPNVNTKINNDDMNTSYPLDFGGENIKIYDGKDGYALYKVVTNLPNFLNENKRVVLCFDNIVGESKIYIKHDEDFWPSPEPKAYCEKLVEQKGNGENINIYLDGFGPSEKVIITVLVKIENEKCGIVSQPYWNIIDNIN